VECGAGVPWETVVHACLEAGRLPLVVPDSLALSVGGTVVAGGYGETSFRCGSVRESVRAMQFVSDGEILEHPGGDVGDMHIAAVVTAVTVTTVAAPAVATVTQVSGHVAELVAMAIASASNCAGVSMICQRRGNLGYVGTLRLRHERSARMQLPGAETADVDWVTHLDRAVSVADARRHSANPWLAALIPVSMLPSFVGALMEEDPALLGARGHLGLRPVRGGRWLADVIRVIEPARAEVVDAALAANRRLADVVAAAGGELYRAATILDRAS
jgi:FAD/FMN-containing dehydrogenase